MPPRGRRLAQPPLGTPGTESEAGTPRLEASGGQDPCAIHTRDRALPQAWHRAAPGQYLLAQTECEAASQGPRTQREPGLQPRPAAALGPLSSQTHLCCHGEVGTARTSVVGASDQVREWTGITPNFQVPSISLRAGSVPRSTQFPRRSGQWPVQVFPQRKMQPWPRKPSQGSL